MWRPPDRDDMDPEAVALRQTYRKGQALGVVLGLSMIGLFVAYRSGAFHRPPPPSDAYPCGDEIVNITEDPANCGECGHACPPELPMCSYGACECANGLEDCDTGCTDLDSDPAHCGACDRSCPPDAPCEGGECRCGDGRTACWRRNDDDVYQSECVDTLTDAHHCGECGRECESGACVAGLCTSS